MKAKLILLILLLNSAFFFAQPVVNLPLTVGDGAASQVVNLGLDPTATDGIDAGLGEAALGAIPAAGTLDARFKLPGGGPIYSLKDYRTGTSVFVGSKTHYLQFQPGSGSFITIVWNFPAGITGRMQDEIDGTQIDVSMSGNRSYRIDNPFVYTSVKITMTYNLNPAGVPDVPVLNAPADLATGVAVNPTLSWLAAAGATSYTLQVSTVNTFLSTVVNQTGITSTSYAVSGLSNNTVYYWRVLASNTNGPSAYTTARSFTTLGTAPSAPNLLSPVNNATGVAINPTFTWSASAGADSYNIQVSAYNDFSILAVDQTVVGATNYTGGGLTQGIQYYWKVSATNLAGTGPYSSVGTFTTIVNATPTTPVLLTPTSGAIDVSPNPNLTWFNTGGGVTYNLVVSTDYWFTNIVLNQVGITNTSYRLVNLTLGTKYYWKVLATNTFGSSSYTATNDFTVTSVMPIPDAANLLTPVNGATGVSTSPTFTWSPMTGATGYTIQVSTVADFSTTVVNQTGLTSPTYTASGFNLSTVYYWKVKVTNSSGTGPYSTPWSFTTTNIPTVPPVPTLLSPADSAINIAVLPTLSWNSSLGATKYTILLSTSATFADTAKIVTNVTTTIYSFTDALQKGTKYYWKVKAYNASDSSAFSTARMFTTVEDIPDVPVLLSPVDGGNIYETNTLSWNPSARAVTYTLQVSTTSNFLNIVLSQSGLTETSYNLTGTFSNSEYYWRVSATNTRGTSAYSASRRFITGPTIPAVPVLVSPAVSAVGVNTTVTFSWGASARADYYALQVSTSPAFTTTVINVPDVFGVSYLATGLSANTTYYWRVKGVNGIGSSAFSTARSFTTVTGPPAAPVLNTPLDNATGISTSTNVTWNASSGASSYTLQVSTNSSFTALLVNQAGLTTTTYSLSLTGGTDYYWRVSAANGSGSSGFSTARKFTTVGTPPALPVLALPADNATNIPLTTTLTWSRPAGATTYNIQVSENAGFTTLFADITGLVDTFYSVTGLRAGVLYYWKVSAVNTYGTNGFTTARSFTTSTVKYGNITGTGFVTSADAIEALRMSVGYTTSSWTPVFAYTTNHYMLADVDNNHLSGFISGSYGVSAYDAYKILWKSLNPTGNLLPIEGGPAKIAASAGLLSLGNASSKGGSDVISIPLVIKNAVNVNSITFELNHDTRLAEIKGVSSSLPKDWLMAYTSENGKTKIVMAGLTPVNESILGNVLVKIYQKEDRVAVSGTAFINESDAQSLETMTVNRIPDAFTLNQNYPNPFNPSTKVGFSVPSESNVRIIIYNTLGQVVKELVNEVKKAGYYETVFNAGGLSSGMYICSMTSKSIDGSGSFTGVKKLILMK